MMSCSIIKAKFKDRQQQGEIHLQLKYHPMFATGDHVKQVMAEKPFFTTREHNLNKRNTLF